MQSAGSPIRVMPVRPLHVLVATIAAAVLSACTADDGHRWEASAEVSVADEVPTMQVGRDYDVVMNVPTELDGRESTLVGWKRDGTELHLQQAARGGKGVSTVLIARTTRTGATTVLSQRPARPILSVGVSGDLVTWIEARTPTRGDLVAHDLEAGDVRVLDRSVAVATDSPAVVREGHVHYIAADPGPDGNHRRTTLRRVPVDGSGEPQDLAEGALDVFAQHWPFPTDGDDRLFVRFADRLEAWDPATGEVVRGTRRPADCGAVAAERVTATCDGDGSRLTLETSDGRVTVTDLPSRPENLQATNRWVAFTTGDAGRADQYVYDLTRERLFRVPQTRVLRLVHSGSRELAVLGSVERPPTEPVVELVRGVP